MPSVMIYSTKLKRSGREGSYLTYVNRDDGHIDIIEEFCVELDRIAGGEENHNFLLLVLLQKREEKQKPILRWTHNITLKQKTLSSESYAILLFITMQVNHRLLLF